MDGPEDGNQFPAFRCDDAACERGEAPCRKHAPKCACTRSDARDCLVSRTPEYFFSEDDLATCERCECSCHDPDENEESTP